MDGMSNIEIMCSLNSYSKFVGVFPSDINPLNFIKSYPSCFIINTNPKYITTGGHWLAFYLTNPNNLEFFDSESHSLSYYNSIFPYFSHIHHSKTNNLILESKNSALCGDYSVSFLYFRMNHFSFNQIIIILSKYQKGKSRDSFVRRIRLLNQRKQ